MTRKPLIVGNWKMKVRPNEAAALMRSIVLGVKKYASELERYSLVVCPSYESIGVCAASSAKAKAPIGLGAQDCFWDTMGAYTGEVSAQSLEDLGCTFCIVGHSERRTVLGETDTMVQKKVEYLLNKTHITPIVCVGENKKERALGRVHAVLKRQVTSALKKIPKKRSVVIAYEPIWAIGSGKVMTPDDCKEATDFILATCQRIGLSRQYVSVLYGGSVTHETIASFVSRGISDGVLIGGASSNAAEFNSLLRALSKIL